MKKHSGLGVIITSLVLLVYAFWGLGCSEDGDGITDGNGIDTDPPEIADVTAIDFLHVEVVFNEEVHKETAERVDHYTIVEAPVPLSGNSQGDMSGQPPNGPAAPNDTLWIDSAALKQDSKTVGLSLGTTLTSTNYNIYVTGVKDVHGNKMTTTQSSLFRGSSAFDLTAPLIIDRSPTPSETGVGTSKSVEVQFSESMDFFSVHAAFSWTGPGGNVNFMFDHTDNNTYIFSPIEQLELDAQYTVGFAANTAKDWAGNYLAAASWTFRTTPTPDLIPPTIISTSPQDGATNVPLNSNLVINFSEPMDPSSFEEGGIIVTPDLGDGTSEGLNGFRTLLFDPDLPLLANTAYSIIIVPGMVADLAGNLLANGASIKFTTGSSLPAGQFSGILSGDPGTPAADPTGAIVVAFEVNFDDIGDSEGPPPAGGSGIAGSMDDYAISRLEDDVYYPIGILDSNNDGILDPVMGDAMGVYGIDARFGDFEDDSVTIAGGGTVTGVDFPLYDFIAIVGTVSYGGSAHADSLAYYRYYVGAFDTTGFDTTGGIPDPDVGSGGDWIAEEPTYVIGEFESGLPPGTYYVGAYMDVNFNDNYDPDTDPAGFYMVAMQFGAVTVQNGTDQLGIDIVLDDPASGSPMFARAKKPIKWKLTTSPERRRLSRNIRDALKREIDRSGL